MDDIQNMQPNCPQLSSLIRENLASQHDQVVKQTLFKESLVKISLEKGFQHIFQQHEAERTQKQSLSPDTLLLEVPKEIKTICSWLEESESFAGAAHLRTELLPKLAHILHQKTETLTIIATEYQKWWLQKMQKLDRLSTLNWAILNPQMSQEEKVQVLELYQLKKLKLLFVAPSLFKAEAYHQFQCDLLVVCDLHLYTKQNGGQIFKQIVDKTQPGRLLGLHSTLCHEKYKSLTAELTENEEKTEDMPNENYEMVKINSADHSDYTFLALKTPIADKPKTIISYITRNNFQNVLIIGSRKSEVLELSKKLQMESFSILNLCSEADLDFHSFTAPEILTRTDKKEQKILELVRKTSSHRITLSLHFDPLRFAEFDAVIFNGFLQVFKFVDYCPQVKNRLMLLADEDYYNLRNILTSDFLPTNSLHRIAIKIMEKPFLQMKEETGNSSVGGFKRCFSQHINDKMLECFSVNKETKERQEEKVIRIHSLCKNFDISTKIFTRLIDVLSQKQAIQTMCRVPFEIEIEEDSLQSFRKLFPKAIETRRKANLLSLSHSMQKTTSDIISEMRLHDLKFKITQETIQIVLLKDFQEINWVEVCHDLNKAIQSAVENIDRSFEVFKEYAYSSIELTRREKFLNRKDRFIEFASQKNPKVNSVKAGGVLESSHRSNLLTAEIEEWLRNSEERLEQHDLILMLQGVEKPRLAHFKKETVFGRYKRFRYEEMNEVVQRITKNKRIKL